MNLPWSTENMTAAQIRERIKSTVDQWGTQGMPHVPVDVYLSLDAYYQDQFRAVLDNAREEIKAAEERANQRARELTMALAREGKWKAELDRIKAGGKQNQ